MIMRKKIFLLGLVALSSSCSVCADDAVPEHVVPDEQPAAEPIHTEAAPAPIEPAPIAQAPEQPALPAEQPPVEQAAPAPDHAVITTAEIESMEPEPVSLEASLDDEFEGEDEEAVLEEVAAVPDVQGGTRGNWYKKQQAVKRAHEEYQTVRKLEAQVMPYEQQVVNKKNEFQHKIEDFSQAVGFAIGQLDQLIADYIAHFDTQRKTDGVMSEADRLQLTDLNEKKRELEQLKKDFEAVKQSRVAIDEAMAMVLKQLSLCHDYEQQAFEKYEKIAHVLSDQIAEQLYIDIKTLGENIQAIDTYLKGEFTTYFDTLLKKANEQIDVVQMSLRTLKERGINLAVSPTAGTPQPAAKPQQPVKTGSVSWVGWLWATVLGVFKKCGAWILSWFH